MTDFGWQDYHKAQEKHFKSTGKAPNVKEYFLIKMVENWLIILIVLLALLFAFSGFFLLSDKKSDAALWFAGLCLGVFLGIRFNVK